MNPLIFHHVGVACKDIERTREFIAKTHSIRKDSGIVFDPVQDVQLCLLEDDAGIALELVCGKIVQNYLKRGCTYYHNCYEVEDLAAAIASLNAMSCPTVVEPVPAVLFDDRPVAFLQTPMGLLELLQAADR